MSLGYVDIYANNHAAARVGRGRTKMLDHNAFCGLVERVSSVVASNFGQRVSACQEDVSKVEEKIGNFTSLVHLVQVRCESRTVACSVMCRVA